jgi:hypothetical protein
MTPRPHPGRSSPLPIPTRLVRHLITTYKRRQLEDLQRRAAWAEQARHAPTLQHWIDVHHDPLDGPARRAPADGIPAEPALDRLAAATGR